MRKIHRILILAATIFGLTLSATAQSQSNTWKDANGKPIPDSESMKSKNDFAGSVIVTIDEDWREKWNSPPEKSPSFRKADTVPYGKKVAVLIFFSNPKLNEQGNANLQCDLEINTPSGQPSLSQKNVSCFAGKIGGGPYSLYLANPVIEFSGDPGDPTGTWEVKVALRDAVRGVELPLRTTFGLREK